jgi:hypothetical protein
MTRLFDPTATRLGEHDRGYPPLIVMEHAEEIAATAWPAD